MCSIEEFHRRVNAGEKLVILDDMVLDVSRFMEEHPGGKFSLEHNIGRDISKFFYGAYQLENKASGIMSFSLQHTHSNDAR